MSEYCYDEAVRDAEATSAKITNGNNWSLGDTWQDKPTYEDLVIPDLSKLETPPAGAAIAHRATVTETRWGARGIGGAPTRVTTLPSAAAERKKYPVATGVLDYFPDAIAEIANISWRGNEQHNPGLPLHWNRSKSTDEADAMMRHFLARGTFDEEGDRHTAKMAWRALAYLQKELEDAKS